LDALFLCALVLQEEFPAAMIIVTPDIRINEDELRFQFKLASGPGGQNVNKVATAAELRFDAAHSLALPEDVRTRLLTLAGRRLSKEGELLITARRFRSQERNRQDAVERLIRAAKQVEVIAPNLPLLYKLPAVDGYDGGLLPLDRYVQLQKLFLPPELLVPDGRLRELKAAVEAHFRAAG
jgi:ribosome-associated protein